MDAVGILGWLTVPLHVSVSEPINHTSWNVGMSVFVFCLGMKHKKQIPKTWLFNLSESDICPRVQTIHIVQLMWLMEWIFSPGSRSGTVSSVAALQLQGPWSWVPQLQNLSNYGQKGSSTPT